MQICACTPVYGPLEDRSRLMPTLIAHAAEHRLPPFVEPETSRDFLYVDDAVRAFLCAAVLLRPEHYGASFNIGSGRKTTIRALAHLAKQEFALEGGARILDHAAPLLGSRRLVRQSGARGRRSSAGGPRLPSMTGCGAWRAGTRVSRTCRCTSAPPRSARSTASTA